MVRSNAFKPAILMRKKKIFKLIQAGVTPKEIAQKLSVSYSTVYRELKSYRAELAKMLQQYDWKSEIMDLYARLNRAVFQLEKLYEETNNEDRKRIIVKTIAEITIWQIKFLQYIGVLEHKPEISVEQNIQINNITKILEQVVEDYEQWRKKNLLQSPLQ